MERLNLGSKLGLYSVALFIMAMPAFILCLTKVFSLGEALVLSNIDWLWIALCVVSGLILLIRLKIAWVVSMVVIFLVAVLNLMQLIAALQGEGEATFQYNFQFLFSITMMASVMLIATHFKYPYLDRRDTLFFGVANRYKVAMDALLNNMFKGVIRSASISGVVFEMEKEMPFKPNHLCNISIPELGLEDEIMAVVSVKGKELRLCFETIGFAKMLRMRKLLKAFPMDAK